MPELRICRMPFNHQVRLAVSPDAGALNPEAQRAVVPDQSGVFALWCAELRRS